MKVGELCESCGIFSEGRLNVAACPACNNDVCDRCGKCKACGRDLCRKCGSMGLCFRCAGAKGEKETKAELCETSGILGTPCNKDNCNEGCL